MSDEAYKTTICDKCLRVFDIKIEERKYEGSVVQQFFRCPGCGREYTVIVTDKKLRDKIEKRKRLASMIQAYGKSMNEAALERKLRELDAMKRNIQKRAENLKERYVKEPDGQEGCKYNDD